MGHVLPSYNKVEQEQLSSFSSPGIMNIDIWISDSFWNKVLVDLNAKAIKYIFL